MRKYRLKWLGRALRMDETESVRLITELYVDGKRGKWNQKICRDVIESDLRLSGVSEEGESERLN